MYEFPPEAIVASEGTDALAQFEHVLLRFTTGTSLYGGSVDISAPSHRVTRFGLSGTGTCSVSPHNIEVFVQAPHTGHLLVIDRIDDDDAPSSDDVVTYFAGTPHDEIVLGHNLCQGGWPGVAHGDRATFRFGTYDVTGVVHWFLRPLTIEIPERVEGYGTDEVEEPEMADDDDDDDTGGCVSVKGRSSGGVDEMSLTACALFALRRRRGRSTTTSTVA